VSAATAVATAESVEADRHRQRLAAIEQERARSARELQDETLQSLASLRLGLAAQLKRPRLDLAIEAIGDAVRQLEIEIDNLRSLIADLRPATLDDLGAEQAIKDLAGRARPRAGGRAHDRLRTRSGMATLGTSESQSKTITTP
jgi:signal transduction histidine kinase